jgi:hypothetical protein
MSNADVMLNAIFGLPGEGPIAAHVATVEGRKCFKTLQKQLPGMASGFWQAAAGEVLSALRQVLDVPIGSVFAAAWNKGREFEKYTDHKQYPPEARYLVALAEHSITFSQEPRVDVLVNGMRAGTVEFKAELRVNFEAAKVAVQNARFVALHTGACTFKGTIECEGATLVERSSRDYTLPGRLSFGAGVPIGLGLGGRRAASDASISLTPPADSGPADGTGQRS